LTASCTIAKLITAAWGGCPAVDMIEVAAIAFQSVTAFARTILGAANAASASAMRSGRIRIFLN
jgi:hypothetical protein